MQQAEITVLLFTLVAALVLVARRIAVPYPVLLVLGGLGLSLIPHLPEMRLQPDMVLYFFLPALLYPAALFTSWRDFRRNLRPILLLAIGLVLFTIVAIAWVTHWLLPGLPWAAAFALGAIVSPPDAVAATTVIRRLGCAASHRSNPGRREPRQRRHRAGGAPVRGGGVEHREFLNRSRGRTFVVAGVGGVGFGLLVGLGMRWVQKSSGRYPGPDHFFVAYTVPRLSSSGVLHLSGVLATVTAGIYLGWHSPLIISARTRLQASAFWEMISFLLNGFVFITIGLQLRGILHELCGDS